MNRIVKSYLTILNREQTGCLMLPYHYYCFVCLLLCTLTAFNLLHKKENKFANGYEPLLEELKQVACYILHISLETSLD